MIGYIMSVLREGILRARTRCREGMSGLFTHLEFELPVRTSLWKQPADNLMYDFGVQEKGLTAVANVEEVVEP